MHKTISKIFFLAVTFLLLSFTGYATHNRAGEITYEQIGDLTIRITIVTYTKTSSHVDRDSLIVFWGDGTTQTIARTNGNGEMLENDIQKNFYVEEHTYPGRGTYTVGMTDPNRIGGILNVNYPNSIRIRFHIATTFTLLSRQFQGDNNSAVLLQPPIDMGCVGKPFVHNPNAFDPDGDSLAYEWAVPLQDVGAEVPNYLFPDQIEPGPQNNISLDPVTGEVVWDSPQRQGQYNIAIRIKEYRQGVLINSIIRDMQIQILDCDNNPPEINVQEYMCVEAGELLELPVGVDDPESGSQLVRLTALGGPLSLDFSPAVFATSNFYEEVPREIDFIWETKCEHIQKENYTVVFKAADNFFDDTSGLVNLKTLNIQVVGPAPPTPNIDRSGNQNTITWEPGYSCSTSENFLGYTVWRRIGSRNIPDDQCLPNLGNYGFEVVGFSGKGSLNEFVDENVQNGVTYCYRITARFAKTSAGGNPYNIVESKPSPEACIKIQRDLPLLTRVSVSSTGTTDGVIDVEWIKPEINIDSMNPDGPYSITLFRSTGLDQSFVEVSGSTVSAESIDLFDEEYTFTDNNLNTVDNQYFYKVQLTSNSREIGFSSIASSIFLRSNEGNNLVSLNWNSVTPWINFNYIIYRRDNGAFVEIGESSVPRFSDRDVINNEEYCYRIEGEGEFLGISHSDTTFNFSQEICVIPDDTTPPCAPNLTVRNNCEDDPEAFLFTNILEYDLSDSCLDNIEDLEARLYYREFGDDDFTEITDDANLSVINSTTANHSSSRGFAGCYVVRMEDQFGNLGPASDTVCVEACPVYILPNVFTPNSDGNNDLFYPLRRAFVQRVNFEAYNRWGNLVYQTNDPEINWQGFDTNGEKVESGTYTYKCEIFLNDQGGPFLFNTISGTIDLIR
ncbi:gliding motility-associated C-terminal domain-containing protein [Membranihabitans maritimus]|uniref:T9SS type B sorting domain-containing protein n=1 Tax=Membranihabitans maritimus TaxID=2904244 RepID=UPI001F2DC632